MSFLCPQYLKDKHTYLPATLLNVVKCLLKISNKVIHIFDANGEAQHFRTSARGNQFILR